MGHSTVDITGCYSAVSSVKDRRGTHVLVLKVTFAKMQRHDMEPGTPLVFVSVVR